MSISAETHTQTRHSAASDAALVRSAQRGDPTAFGQLYERYMPYIARILSDDVSDPEARADISQSVFEKGWSKLGGLRDPNAFRPWLAQLARRLIVDHYRASSRTVATDFTDPTQNHEIVDDGWSAHDWAAMRDLAERLQVGIEGLSTRDVTVLELATSFGFNSVEIAAALDIEVSHARVLLHRARRRLSRELTAQYA